MARKTPVGAPAPTPDDSIQESERAAASSEEVIDDTELADMTHDGLDEAAPVRPPFGGERPPAAPPVRRAPNPELLRMDPMAEVFGPGSNVKFIGDAENDEMPDEIRGLIEENGLGKRDFSCTLKEIPAGSTTDTTTSSSTSVYIRAWKRSIPSLDYIAREHGPGNYVLILAWRYLDREENVHKMRREEVPVMISEKCAAEHKKNVLDKKIKEAGALGAKVRDAVLENELEGQLISAISGNRNDDKKQSPKEYLEELMTTVRTLGLPVGGFGIGGSAPKIEWDKVLAVAAPIVTGLLAVLQQSAQRRSEESNKMMMLMLSQNQNASSQVIEMYKTMATKPPADNPLKELQQMVMSAMDIKQLMNPEKETLSDKIFRVVEMVAPQILTIAAQAAATNKPPSGPMVNMAKKFVSSDPDFTALHNDPVEIVKFVNKLDDRLGWENADIILQTVEWNRPPQCPRDPSRRLPPQEGAEDAEIEEAGAGEAAGVSQA